MTINVDQCFFFSSHSQFAIIIRRKTLYYFFNLIVPCVLIASMALLGDSHILRFCSIWFDQTALTLASFFICNPSTSVRLWFFFSFRIYTATRFWWKTFTRYVQCVHSVKKKFHKMNYGFRVDMDLFLVMFSTSIFHSGVTILLSLTVFLNMVAETMPATSDGNYSLLFFFFIKF